MSEPRNRKYLRLLVALGILIFSGPISVVFPAVGGTAFDLLFALMLLSAIWDTARNRRLLAVGIVFGLPAVATHVITVLWSGHPTLAVVASEATAVVFLGYIIFELTSDVFDHSRRNTDDIRGAICIYLLLGFAFGAAHIMTEALAPGSYEIGVDQSLQDLQHLDPETRDAVGREIHQSLYYYSFVTLTTLGFGDITPATQLARTLTWVEAVVGQLFIAIAIARLVGMRFGSDT